MGVNKRYVLSSLWLCLIAFLSLVNVNSDSTPGWTDILHADKIGHLVVYGILAYLMRRDRIHVVVVFLVVILFGTTMEFLQERYFEFRQFELLDIIANISGALIGMVIYQYFQKKKLTYGIK